MTIAVEAAAERDQGERGGTSAAGGSCAAALTLRIRDRGGGIAPGHLRSIWNYSFTTVGSGAAADALAAIGASGSGMAGASGVDGSSLAGLGYGLPLSRAYAESFGGGIEVQSLWGWGTDVYVRLRGLGGV